MSKKLYEESNIQSIANAIREKNGTQNSYRVSDMAEAILDLPTISPSIQPLSVSHNGIYNPPSGVDGYAPVTVNVSGGVLPSGYTQKQYLEASGTQYIDTGIKAQGGCYAEVEFEFVASIDGWHSIISGDNTNVKSAFKLMHHGMTGGTVQYYDYYHDFPKSFQIGQKYFACISNGLSIDNEFLASFGKSTFISGNNIGLFANITGSAVVEAYFTGRIYSCRIWLDGVIVRDFIPCIRDSDSVAGMYDIVNDVFYTNAGTGSFAYA